ncbi:beta-ketoacyl-ACP reductase, partial [Streptococcus gordonii]|nr:beta-ketoacyl-ACP reductase [Streptococcus gordonii]
MDNQFKNKTVVITGAARGIGEGIAVRFAKAGANLV